MARLTEVPRPVVLLVPPAAAKHDCLVYVAPVGTFTDVKGWCWAEYECQCCGDAFTVFLGTDVEHVAAQRSDSGR